MAFYGEEENAFLTVGETQTVSTVKGTTKIYTGTKENVHNKAKDFRVGENNVVSVEIRDEEGGVSELRVTHSHVSEIGANIQVPAIETPSPNYELQMIETAKELAEHPDLIKTGNLAAWNLFVASPVEVQMQQKYLVDPNNSDSPRQALPSNLEDWANLFNKGIKTYIEYNPIVCQVKIYRQAQPDSSLINGLPKREDPPVYADMAEDWLKTGDNVAYDGNAKTWTRTEQWTGAHEWPELLYKSDNTAGGAES